jgi:hypothetical protein
MVVTRWGDITMEKDGTLVVNFAQEEDGMMGDGQIVYLKEDPEYDTVLASVKGGIKPGETKPMPAKLPGDELDLSDLNDYDDL